MERFALQIWLTDPPRRPLDCSCYQVVKCSRCRWHIRVCRQHEHPPQGFIRVVQPFFQRSEAFSPSPAHWSEPAVATQGVLTADLPLAGTMVHSMWQTNDALCYTAHVAARSGKRLPSRDTPDDSGDCISGCKGSTDAH